MKKEDMVKLISAEGFEFVIDKDAAMVSQTIYNMLTSPGLLSLSLSLSRLQLGFHSRSSLYCILESIILFKQKLKLCLPQNSLQIFMICVWRCDRKLCRDTARRSDFPWDQYNHIREDLQVFLLASSICQVLICFVFHLFMDFSTFRNYGVTYNFILNCNLFLQSIPIICIVHPLSKNSVIINKAN